MNMVGSHKVLTHDNEQRTALDHGMEQWETGGGVGVGTGGVGGGGQHQERDRETHTSLSYLLRWESNSDNLVLGMEFNILHRVTSGWIKI